MTSYADIEQRILDATARQDFDETARLARIASQLKKLDEQKSHLLASIDFSTAPDSQSSLAPVLDDLEEENSAGEARTSSRGGLSVELIVKGTAPIRICERNSTETVVALMEQVLILFGMPGLERLMQLRVSRGPLVSRDPQKDFLNTKSGDLYAHRRIPGTTLYVLTHSDNQQKIKDIGAALRLLGLPNSGFLISNI
jgi:hypothetical protein